MTFDEDDNDEQIGMLVDLYDTVFTTIGEPRHLPHPNWFRAEIHACYEQMKAQERNVQLWRLAKANPHEDIELLTVRVDRTRGH